MASSDDRTSLVPVHSALRIQQTCGFPAINSASEGTFELYEPYLAQQGGFSFSGSQTPTAIVT